MLILNKKFLKTHLKETLFIALGAFPLGLLFCTSCISSLELTIKSGLLSSGLWVFMWKGNEFIADWLDLKFEWLKEPKKRLISGVIGHAVYPSMLMFFLNYIFYLLYGWNSEILTLQGAIKYSIPAIIITFLISMFLTARSFFFSWRQLAVNEEKMKKEVISSQFESLKSQVNPHFLFNSLNVLTSLVYEDPDLSARFIKELSNVYRYVLDVKDKELVDLNAEVEFLKSYTFLLKIRHNDGFEIHINLPENGDLKVAPLALQMLVENAVKHNIISKEEPLAVFLKMEDGYLTVRNNIQLKDRREIDDPNVGLKNINARYEFLANQSILISKTDKIFEVKLPILTLDN